VPSVKGTNLNLSQFSCFLIPGTQRKLISLGLRPFAKVGCKWPVGAWIVWQLDCRSCVSLGIQAKTLTRWNVRRPAVSVCLQSLLWVCHCKVLSCKGWERGIYPGALSQLDQIPNPTVDVLLKGCWGGMAKSIHQLPWISAARPLQPSRAAVVTSQPSSALCPFKSGGVPIFSSGWKPSWHSRFKPLRSVLWALRNTALTPKDAWNSGLDCSSWKKSYFMPLTKGAVFRGCRGASWEQMRLWITGIKGELQQSNERGVW